MTESKLPPIQGDGRIRFNPRPGDTVILPHGGVLRIAAVNTNTGEVLEPRGFDLRAGRVEVARVSGVKQLTWVLA